MCVCVCVCVCTCTDIYSTLYIHIYACKASYCLSCVDLILEKINNFICMALIINE